MKRRIVALLLVVLSTGTMFGCGKDEAIDTSDITIDGVDTSSNDLFSTTEYSTDLNGGMSVADEAQTFGNTDMSINTSTGEGLDLQGAMSTDPAATPAETTPAATTPATTPAATPATSTSTTSSTPAATTTNYTYTDTSAVMYATSNVKVRDLPSTSGKQVSSFTKDAEVTVTGKCNETGWYRVKVSGGTGYVSNNYLTSTKPATATAPSTTTPAATTNTTTNTTTGTTTGTYTITDMTATMTTNDNVKVRSLPYTNGTELTTLAKGTTVTITGQCKETSWYRINVNGAVGYISNNYVSGQVPSTTTTTGTSTNGTYTITETIASMKATAGVNVRNLPHSTGSKLGSIAAGQLVQVTGRCNETGWYRINLNGQTGYVSGQYLIDTSPASQTNTTLGATTPSNNTVTNPTTTTITATTTPATATTTIVPYTCTLYATNAITVTNQPAAGGSALGTIAYGNAVYCTGLAQQNGQNTGWLQINFNGTTGYIPNANLTSLQLPQQSTQTTTTTTTTTTPATTGSYTITDANATMTATTQVKVRNLPAQTGTQIGSLLANQPVTVTGKCNETGWYRISYNGAVGYVSNQYLK